MQIIDKRNKFERAKKRVDELKKFYKHLLFYIVINGFFIGRRIFRDIEHGDSLIEAITDVSNYKLFFWWTIILVIHGLKVYRFDYFFDDKWKARKIKEEMNNYEREK